MIKRLKWVMLVTFASFCLSSCAFGTRRPVLSYTPVTSPSPSNGIAIRVTPFNDQRFDKDLVGYMRNGYAMRTAKVITQTNVADWVTEALKAELRNAGYNVVADTSPSVVVEGEVLEVFCDALLQYEGKAAIEVTLKRGDSILLKEKYRGTDEDINIAGTSKSFGIVLERSLQEALRKAVHDIDGKLKSR